MWAQRRNAIWGNGKQMVSPRYNKIWVTMTIVTQESPGNYGTNERLTTKRYKSACSKRNSSVPLGTAHSSLPIQCTWRTVTNYPKNICGTGYMSENPEHTLHEYSLTLNIWTLLNSLNITYICDQHKQAIKLDLDSMHCCGISFHGILLFSGTPPCINSYNPVHN